MFHVKKMQPSDFSFAVDIANTMSWNMTVEDFKFNKSLEPDGCFVLLDDSKRVGLATCISYGRVGWFGNLIVKENYRGKGAGSLLISHAVQYLKSAGASSVGLYAYEHLVDFYGKLGFKPNANFSVLKAEAVLCTNNADKVNTASEGNLQGISDFDCRCFGASREKLLKKIICENANPFYVAAEDDCLVGYATAKVYDEMTEIGPMLCLRRYSGHASTLLNSLLDKLEGTTAFMCLPTADTALLDLAAKAGFKKKFGVARMFLGAAIAQDCINLAESLERG